MSSLYWRDADDARAVRDFHAPLYRKWRRQHGGVYACAKEIPGFVESIQQLHDYGYSLTDIGVMWGLSRERIRQLFVKHSLRRRDGRASFRIWDDDLALFLPVSKEEYRALEAKAMERRRVEKQADQRHAALREDIETVREAASKLGRQPTISDLCEVYGYSRSDPLTGPAYRWGYADCTYTEALDRLFDAAGIDRENGHTVMRKARQREDVAAIQAFVKVHGRAPTHKEVADAVGASQPGAVAGRWSGADGRGYADAMKTLYDTASIGGTT